MTCDNGGCADDRRTTMSRRGLIGRSLAVSAPHGLPTGSLTVLSLIAANAGTSQSALAARAGINKSALVGIVDELEQRGLAARDRSSHGTPSSTSRGETPKRCLKTRAK